MRNLDDAVKKLFKEIMSQCKAERREKNDITYAELSKKIGKASGYANAFENARTFPSIKTFLSYLLANNFDVEPLKRLRIPEASEFNQEAKLKATLCDKIMMLDYEGVAYLSEQLKVLDLLKAKRMTPNANK